METAAAAQAAEETAKRLRSFLDIYFAAAEEALAAEGGSRAQLGRSAAFERWLAPSDERRRAEDGVGWQFFARQGRVVRDAPRAVDRLIEKHSVPLGEPTSEEIADAAQFVFSGGVEEPLLSPSELASRFGA